MRNKTKGRRYLGLFRDAQKSLTQPLNEGAVGVLRHAMVGGELLQPRPRVLREPIPLIVTQSETTGVELHTNVVW